MEKITWTAAVRRFGQAALIGASALVMASYANATPTSETTTAGAVIDGPVSDAAAPIELAQWLPPPPNWGRPPPPDWRRPPPPNWRRPPPPGGWYRPPPPPPVWRPAPRPPLVVLPRAHVNYCLRKYRSYNPRTDMYLGYDGRYHYCRSPYRR